MTREFQILYQLNGGDVKTVLAIAESEDQLRDKFANSGLHVIGIAAVRPVIDWTQPNFDRDEAAEFLRMKSGTLSLHKGNGSIPWSKIGAGIYPRRLLEQYVMDNANPAAQALARRLEE